MSLLLSIILMVPYVSYSSISVEEIIIEEPSSDLARATRVPERKGEWIVTPDVRLCNHAPVNILDVHKAVDWWKIKVGATFESVSEAKDTDGCVIGPKLGSIFIKLGTSKLYDGNYLGLARVYRDSVTNDILWVEIELHSKVKERVLAHEIGHALGWGHVYRKNHLMHPNWDMGGWNNDGLTK